MFRDIQVELKRELACINTTLVRDLIDFLIVLQVQKHVSQIQSQFDGLVDSHGDLMSKMHTKLAIAIGEFQKVRQMSSLGSD